MIPDRQPRRVPAVLDGRRQFERVVDKVLEHTHRTLFDFLELQSVQEPHIRRRISNVKRRLHLGLSITRRQIHAAFEMYVEGEGGGRSPDDDRAA